MKDEREKLDSRALSDEDLEDVSGGTMMSMTPLAVQGMQKIAASKPASKPAEQVVYRNGVRVDGLRAEQALAGKGLFKRAAAAAAPAEPVQTAKADELGVSGGKLLC